MIANENELNINHQSNTYHIADEMDVSYYSNIYEVGEEQFQLEGPEGPEGGEAWQFNIQHNTT